MTDIKKLKEENNRLTKMIYDANTKRKGYWQVDDVNPIFSRCSVCKEGWETSLTKSFFYCPTCGAEIIKENKE